MLTFTVYSLIKGIFVKSFEKSFFWEAIASKETFNINVYDLLHHAPSVETFHWNVSTICRNVSTIRRHVSTIRRHVSTIVWQMEKSLCESCRCKM
ncbi:hypothetical protein [Tolypothrix sp. VBCCA 56010]|uniref:hypothetical protein n=1 Tax=Tolypothrix sp. VBCCA 56010 TaxID=3137731 RepID=UPI003D7E902C